MIKDLSPVYDLIRADGSIVINKALSHSIGLIETVVYSELLSRYNYFNIREELDSEGYFFNTLDDFERATTLDAKHQKKAIDNLVKLGLVKTKLKGNPAKRHFFIVDDTPMILAYIQNGKEKIKILQEKQKEETEKSMQRRKERLETKRNQQFGENGETSLEDIDKQDSPNQLGNNTNPNNTNSNNTLIEGSKARIREGKPNGVTKSISFPDFLMKDIKRYNTSYRFEIVETILYYYGKYFDKFGEEHFRYTVEQLKEIYSRLDYIFDIGINDNDYGKMLCVDADTLKEVIDQHFVTNYSGNMKWTLLSFLNDNILKNRCYEVGCV
jgi:hypothetical protein